MTSAAVPKTEPPSDDFQMPSASSFTSMEQTPIQSVKNQSHDKSAAAAASATAMVTLGATSNANATMEDRKNDVEWFAQYVAQRLYRQTDDLKRRKLESAIQETIAKTEKEFF